MQGAATVKLNLKRILFIVICAELLLIYWSNVELNEVNRRDLLTRNKAETGFPAQPSS